MDLGETSAAFLGIPLVDGLASTVAEFREQLSQQQVRP